MRLATTALTSALLLALLWLASAGAARPQRQALAGRVPPAERRKSPLFPKMDATFVVTERTLAPAGSQTINRRKNALLPDPRLKEKIMSQMYGVEFAPQPRTSTTTTPAPATSSTRSAIKVGNQLEFAKNKLAGNNNKASNGPGAKMSTSNGNLLGKATQTNANIGPKVFPSGAPPPQNIGQFLAQKTFLPMTITSKSIMPGRPLTGMVTGMRLLVPSLPQGMKVIPAPVQAFTKSMSATMVTKPMTATKPVTTTSTTSTTSTTTPAPPPSPAADESKDSAAESEKRLEEDPSGMTAPENKEVEQPPEDRHRSANTKEIKSTQTE